MSRPKNRRVDLGYWYLVDEGERCIIVVLRTMPVSVTLER